MNAGSINWPPRVARTRTSSQFRRLLCHEFARIVEPAHTPAGRRVLGGTPAAPGQDADTHAYQTRPEGPGTPSWFSIMAIWRGLSPPAEPMSETKPLTRRELYDLVWSRPMIRLADEFGVTGTGLAKICQRHDVPTPPRGYWAKLQHSKRVSQEPFVPATEPTKERVVIQGGTWRLPDEARQVIRRARQQKAERTRPAPTPLPAEVPLPAEPDLHPLLRRTALVLRKAKPDTDGAAHATSEGTVGIVVAQAAVERAISIADALVRCLADRDLAPEATGKGLQVSRGADRAVMTLTERTRREPHVPTATELAAEERRKKRLERYWANRTWNTPSPGQDL